MPGEKYKGTFEMINRSDFPVTVASISRPSGTPIITEEKILAPNEDYTMDVTLFSRNQNYFRAVLVTRKRYLGYVQSSPEALIGVPETPAAGARDL